MEAAKLLSRFGKSQAAGAEIASKLDSVQTRVGSLAERLNIIEAGLQTEDAEKQEAAASEMKELKAAVGGIEASLRSTIELLAGLREARAADEAEMKVLKDRLEKVEKGLQAFL